MAKLYKLTMRDNTTYGGAMRWGAGVTNEVPIVTAPLLCSSDVIHAYESIEIALLLNPVHADIRDFKLWLAEGEIVVDDGTKVGVFALTTIKELPIPEWYANKNLRLKVQLAFAIACAEAVLPIFEEHYPEDLRPQESITAAKICSETEIVFAVAAARAVASATDAAYAARAAADAATARAATDATDAAYIARAAARAARAAASAARASAAAARASADAARAAVDATDTARAAVAAYAADAAYAAVAAARAARADAADAADAARAAVAAYAADINLTELAIQVIKKTSK